MAFLFKSSAERGRIWSEAFARLLPDMQFRTWPEVSDAADIRYLAAWTVTRDLLEGLPNLEVLFSVGAGVDQLDLSQVPDHIQVVRMMEPGLTDGMVQYATFATLALHREMLDYRQAQADHRWAPRHLLPAGQRRVGVMGLGTLGTAVLGALRLFGFPLRGWSRSGGDVEGVEIFAGADALPAFLSGCDILICLLPLTDQTRGILCRKSFDLLPRGAGIINVGRGGHLMEHDLLSALDCGQLSGAVIDVLNTEPAAADHPFWSHPRILLTPHVASQTRDDSSVEVLIANIRRHQAGQPMQGQVDRSRGY
ncbi:2-hydroxyacid dehydrogenase [Niveispirillum cyanobacteriorum]|nr:glyoxylate/hydroxypyruvate reductase A [Niveispirillum cyanobacteriorum]GGE77810.1 glyoxylate/hydroxypyruvate reductase A [Niveispirillum cyanobacteriorum]